MNVVHCASQRVKLGARLATFLQLALQTTQNVVERQSALPWGTCATAHSSHPDQSLWLHCRSSLRTRHSVRCCCAIRTSVAKRARLSSNAGALATQCAVRWWILLRFSTRSGLGILFREYADDACGDFMVDNSCVVFANDVDTEFLAAGLMLVYRETC